MSIKYSYEPGMCKATHYNGLWPVKYEGTSGLYKKLRWYAVVGLMDVKMTAKYLRMHQKYIQRLKNG